MTRAEFNELGITEEQYEEMFGEKAVFDDEAAAETATEAVAESTIEVPEIAETATETAEETSTTEVAAETAEEPTAEATVAAIVPAEAKAEVIATGAAMGFANIKAAAEYLANELNLKVSNTLDGLYKTKRRGSNKNHGYIVTFNEDKTVQLAKIAQ
jgi:hypothetical protein